jgi:hypothetical protein
MESLVEILERAIQAQGRLLRVERAPLAGPAGARASSALRLTFDVGIVTVRPGEDESGLEVQVGPGAGPESPVFVSAVEEDPWWRVMGCPLTRVQAQAAGGVRVQFRGDQENPRWLALLPRGGGIEASAKE